ncbi:hypothetical protein M409DRAFT_55934 [Zasmidium cellare ATCC 36951]|uniref:Histone deacetylase n=1 Tax=Zasmidium cellare ATCC 36951 TaxID=1080233 RepID=A0A6A6CFU5_ZASCE|nr:uncharacterized protein M409DRAFT_55934 [Zasmidium cellare ATCC 36951]KAF2165028.1 hypothetical protein M409DRAFT_55934 [Zasmidium cellare ATCC 36951]
MESDPDTLMLDGEVVETTEDQGQAAIVPGSTLKVELSLDATETAPPTAASPRTQALLAPVLKGPGFRRDAEPKDQTKVFARKDGPKPAKFSSLPYATSQTGLVYDVRMRFHVEAEPSEDDLHPEDPRRIHAIFEAFVNAGLAWREDDSGPIGDYFMGRIDTRLVTKDEVCLVHTVDHWNWVRSLSGMSAPELQVEQQYPGHMNDSIYLSSSTPYCAQLSAGGAIEACRAVVLGKVKNVFAVIRPPGHHAEREDAKGFCFFDNVSIALKVCQREFGTQCRKVLVLDWDVHHGNGIQQANYDDPNVLYISVHLHLNGGFYPECSYRDKRGPYGDHLHCGEGEGLGFNVNIPWSKPGMGDADYIYAFQQVVMPIATDFNPDLVIIAAGFDAAKGDMLGKCEVTPTGYAHMTHMLMSLAGGKVAVCLEGGYNLESIARSATAVARTLMGEPPDRLLDTEPTKSGVDDVKRVLRQQSRFWKTLHPKDPSTKLSGPLRGVRMHNVVRDWQAEVLFDEYRMTPLFIHRQQISKEFENQVLATSNYSESRPLLLILHDPPELIASPDPRTGKVELHNTWLTDPVKTYVDWAVKQGFAVIDVNLPKHVTAFDADGQEHNDNDSVENRTREATMLLTYLWENHIELNDPTHVFLMGTNIGHAAIINFIKSHEDQAQSLITETISFVVDVGLMSCKSATNDMLPGWYYQHSMVFIARDHHFWQSDFVRKPRKRFGHTQQSSSDTISDMLIDHKDAIFELLLEDTVEWRGQQIPSDNGVGSDSAQISPSKLPPVHNFAFSPGPRTPGTTSSATMNNPAVAGNRSPTKLPQSFAPSPRQ